MLGNKIYEMPALIYPYSQEHRELSQSFNIIEDEHNWLEDAVPFDVYVSKSKRLRGLVNSIFAEVENIIPIHNHHRYREVVKMVLINLWHGHFIGKPVMYSRDRAYYAQNSRYGKLFIKYDRLMPVIDAFEALGYIQQKWGFWDRDKKFGRITRMWSTFKLWRQFATHNLNKRPFYSVARPENVIVLREGGNKNREIKFTLTPAIRRLRDDLECYNDFLEQHNITLNLDKSVSVSTEFLTNILYKGILNNAVEVESIKLSPRVGSFSCIGTIHRPVVQSFTYQAQYTDTITNKYFLPYHYLYYSMTQRFLPDALVFFGFKELDQSAEMMKNYLADLSLSISMDPVDDRRSARLAEEYPLKDIGIDHLILRLCQEYIHRVFNRKSFELGGRGYGALHQRIPKHLRRSIQIDGKPTVELDYSAYHILMLYHEKGIDYPYDPYLVCEGPEMRDTYKTVGLVGINAKNVVSARHGIEKELRKRGIPLPADEEELRRHIKRLINRFRDEHPDIADCLYKDKGIHLMNIDSRIMNTILVKLMEQDIVGLSVYDSIIVAEQHRDVLYQLMMDEYKKEMGFKPRIG